MKTLLLLLLVACGNKSAGPTNTPPTGKPPGTLDTCSTDADCTLTSESCCGCNAGGKNVAIRKDAEALYTAEHKQSCEGTMCPAVMSNDPSCHADAACEAGKCVAKPKPGGADAPPPM
jgi:hypothetical protein